MDSIDNRVLLACAALALVCTACSPRFAGREGPAQVSHAGTSTPAHVPSPATVEKKIAALVVSSPCADHVWGDRRGRAPIGYVKGLALTYAKSFCEIKRGEHSAAELMASRLGDAKQDALSYYRLKLPSANERLRGLYTLALGLGMRESSGNTTEGWDRSAKSPTADTAEAGLFQTSYDSMGRSPWLKTLWDAYRANASACRLDVFREGIEDDERPVIGIGAGADFQRFTKECPGFATEYAMVVLRVSRAHYGPINCKEAEYLQSCYQLLADVEAIAEPACAQRGRK